MNITLQTGEFKEIADRLLNNYRVVLGKERWEIVDLEIYYYGIIQNPKSSANKDYILHYDPYAKCFSPYSNTQTKTKQRNSNITVTKNKIYINVSEELGYGAIVINAIKSREDNKLIEGKKLVASKFIKMLFGNENGKFENKCIDLNTGFVKCKKEYLEFTASPRYNLTNCKYIYQNPENYLQFAMKNYRFTTSNKLTKGKFLIKIAEFLACSSEVRRNDLLSSNPSLSYWLQMYNMGRILNTLDKFKNLSLSATQHQCELYGYFDR